MASGDQRPRNRGLTVLKWAGFVMLAAGAFVIVWARLIPTSAWYRDGRPTRFGKLTNRTIGRYASVGVPSLGMVTLEVPGRRSGRTTSTVLVLLHHAGGDYLVSMLGNGADWVRNVHAAGGHATIRHGKRRAVQLEEVAATERPPILKAYLQLAPGGRPHFPVGPDADVSEFEPIAASYPVFRVAEATATGEPAT